MQFSCREIFHFCSPIALTGMVLISMGLMSSLPTGTHIAIAQFGYQVIIGAGLNLIMPALLFSIKAVAKDDMIASAMGAIKMARTLGGCIGLAIYSSLLHSRLDSELPIFLTPTQIAETSSSSLSVEALSRQERARVAKIYEQSYSLQFSIMMAFAAVNVVAAVVLWRAIWKRDQAVDKEDQAKATR